MGYRVLGRTQDLLAGYEPRRGIEGPFVYANGRVLYYDPQAGQYWDPRSDFYVDHEEMNMIHSHMVEALK